MAPHVTRRRFLCLSAAAAIVGGGGYGVYREVRRIRETVARLSSV